MDTSVQKQVCRCEDTFSEAWSRFLTQSTNTLTAEFASNQLIVLQNLPHRQK